MDAAAIDQLLAALVDTAEDLLQRPDAALNDIHTLPRADQAAQLVEWNTALAPGEPCPHGARHVRAPGDGRPDAIALAQGDAQMSYGELDRRSDELAKRLQGLGVRSGDGVGLLLDRSMAAIVAQLGILKAGGAYVPVPTDFPPERVAYMLGEAGAHHVLTTQAHQYLIPPITAFCCSTNAEDNTNRTPWNPPALDAESVAYVMYTSGSTGTPKGIEICHRSILRLVVRCRLRRARSRPRHAACGAAGLRRGHARDLGPAAQRRRAASSHDETRADRRRPGAHHRAPPRAHGLAHRRALQRRGRRRPAHLSGLRHSSPAAKRCRCRTCGVRWPPCPGSR